MNKVLSHKIKTLFTVTVLFGFFLMGGCTEIIVHVSTEEVSSDADGNGIPKCDLAEKSLEINLYDQITDQSCWAASAQMVMNYHFKRAERELLEQCFIVDAVFVYPNRKCCAQDPKTVPDCQRGYWPEKALKLFNFDYSQAKENPENLEELWGKLTSQICGNQPVIYEKHFIGGGAHSHVIFGFGKDDLTGRWVELYDHQSVTENSISDSSNSEPDFQQVNFENDLFWEASRDDPIRKAVYYIFDIQPFFGIQPF